MNNLWVQTDDATGQHVQAIAGEPGAYRFIDTIGLSESQYAVITDEARVSGQDLQNSEFIREYLHPYGYESADASMETPRFRLPRNASLKRTPRADGYSFKER